MNVWRWIGCHAVGCRRAVRAAVGLAALLGTLALGERAGEAALLRLRSACQSDSAVLTLGDVAEIVAADEKQAHALAAIELFPAPPAGRQRFIRLREIQDLLLLRGVNLAEHRFSGSSRVVVSGGGGPADAPPEPSLSAAGMRTAKRRVTEGVAAYLREKTPAGASWNVEVELDAGDARRVMDPGRAISISGGAAPWLGLQRFEVTVDTPEGPVRFPVQARVASSPAVVVAIRSLPRGSVVRAADVELQRGVPEAQRSMALCSVEQAVGKETTRAIAKGNVLQHGSVRSPLLVRRGDVVTVYARSAGICVRTLGRARDDGSLGELVTIESLRDRSTFFAQVSNVREVDVYARSARADRASIGGPTQAARR